MYSKSGAGKEKDKRMLKCELNVCFTFRGSHKTRVVSHSLCADHRPFRWADDKVCRYLERRGDC